MQVLVTRKEEITGKKNGVKYVKLSYVTPIGGVGECFTTEEKYLAFGVDEGKFLVGEQLRELLGEFKSTVLDFDQKGFLVGAK